MDKDGTEGKALTSDEILSAFDRDEVDFPEEPQEFTLDPLEFQLAPRGFQKITVCYGSNTTINLYYNWKKPIRQSVSKILKITLTSGCYGEYDRKLLICTEDDEIVDSIPVKAKCIPPTLIKSKDKIVLKDCFTQFPYPATFTVHNPSQLSGIFCCIAQVCLNFFY
jgi:hypothetical protein